MSDIAPPAALSPVKQALLEIRRLRARLAEVQAFQPEPAAIIGMAVRFPNGIVSLDGFWKILAAGESAISDVPASRWDSGALFSVDPDQPGKTYSRHGGFVRDPDHFDAEFFGITPREAEGMDPQHRLLLELSAEALEHAGIPATDLAGTKTGVFIGLCNSDYGRLLLETRDDIDAYSSFGAAHSIAAGRISYFLDAKGPSLVVDTSCSSSLVAVHAACQSLAAGESNLSIVGACNLILAPDATVSFSHARMLSRDGACRTFDAGADGYVRGEGCAVIILKRLRDAVADGDRVLAVLRGSAINHDGRSAGLTAPNGPAQTAVIQAALRAAGLTAGDVDYVEAHGTGTPLGDPIELQALGAAYGAGRPAERPLLVGSVKTNIGHLETTAGLAGLIKAVLALQHEAIPPHLNCATPTPHVEWDRLHVAVVQTLHPWPRTADRLRRGGVSSFGFSGTNVHVVLEEAPDAVVHPMAAETGGESLFVVSARSASALRELVQRYIAWLDNSDAALDDICFSSAKARAHYQHRLALIVGDKMQLAAALRSWRAEGRLAGLPAVTNTQLTATQSRYLEGGNVDWDEIYRPGAAEPRRVKIELPMYPFQRQRFWRPAVRNPDAHPSTVADWPRLVAAVRSQSETGPLGWNPSDYPTRWRQLDELTISHVINTLIALGEFASPGARASADEIVVRHGVVPLYRNLIDRWLKLLAREGILQELPGTFASALPLRQRDLAAQWREIEQRLSDDPDTLTYLQRASGKLVELLTGRVSPLEILFERGSLDRAESIYERSPSARYMNAIVASAVRSALADHRGNGPFRMLEAGAGTGGTTAGVAEFFPPDGEYWFTDLSDAFLARARRKFGNNPAFQFSKFNLDLPAPEQLPAGQFDVVLAANVVHATRDVGATLDRLRALLKPGGLLILLESTTNHSHYDLTIAFVEGWNNFADSYRTDQPLLPVDRWVSLLQERGFTAADRFPVSGASADHLGQHVIIGRNDLHVETARVIRPTIPARATEATLPADVAPLRFTGSICADRRDELTNFVRLCAAQVMQINGDDRPGARERFSDLGMDSLMALQLHSLLANGLGLGERLPTTVALHTGTVESLTEEILRLASEPDLDEPVLRAPIRAGSPVFTAHDLEAISESDVLALLAQRLPANRAAAE